MAGALYLKTGMAGREDFERRNDLSWKEFFRDPSLWWDKRSTKRNPRQPDFKHKLTKQPLWMDSPYNPSWVAEELISRGFTAHHANTAEALSPSLIWACCKTKDLSTGIKLHNELQSRGLAEKNYSRALVSMYAKCGDLQRAQALLDKHNSSSIVPWNALIAGYARQGKGQNALDCFEQMQREGISPNSVTYTCILKACARMRAIDKGKKIHEEISKQGLLEHDIILSTALVDMYAKCGCLPQAQGVLEKLPSRSVVSWNALVAGYAQQGHGRQALDCYEQMRCEGIQPDSVTYTCILKACAGIRAIDKGKQIHNEILRQGLLEHDIMLSTALVDMYAKCSALPQAQSVLEKLLSRDAISWSALITGYAQEGKGQQALECYERMQSEGIHPDSGTYVAILNACALTGAIDKGKHVHDEILRQELLEHDSLVGNALVDMYAKCGALPQAQSVLEKLPFRDVVSWNTLITGYAQKGKGQQALECYEQMQQEGILPDAVTYHCLLNMCSHLGLVEEGQGLFDSMEAVGGLKPDLECFTCMVDLLGRAGHLIKAVEVIQGMPFTASSAIWHCLLGACLKWVDVNVGTWAFEQAIEVDRSDVSVYVLMVNIFAAAGMQEKAKDIETMRIKNKAWKLPWCSSRTDTDDRVHEFFIGDTKPAQSEEIDMKLRGCWS
ncbi:hypothetical protein GOP47_0005593 [Adiantum capillus-veneris]|uniref:Pentatricopeptide repeat-containing protein n=1 Tax=Adiantum capillus-veneris TaxID=13818 RepID=A0A9D4V5E9_ADICA|nr:hypothetical protein GOP47_0005593 [Adiantum capillus-veneris]